MDSGIQKRILLQQPRRATISSWYNMCIIWGNISRR